MLFAPLWTMTKTDVAAAPGLAISISGRATTASTESSSWSCAPGQPSEWSIDWTDMDDGGKYVGVDMWTRQEGRSDSTLELHLHRDDTGRWRPRATLDLHVL